MVDFISFNKQIPYILIRNHICFFEKICHRHPQFYLKIYLLLKIQALCSHEAFRYRIHVGNQHRFRLFQRHAFLVLVRINVLSYRLLNHLIQEDLFVIIQLVQHTFQRTKIIVLDFHLL